MATRHTYHHHDLPRAARDKALELLASGANDLSLPAVARALGVSHAALYRHFEGRRGLLAALARDAYESFGEQLAARTGGLSGDALLAETFATYFDFARQQPGAFRALFHPELLDKSDVPELEAVAAARFEALRAVLRGAGIRATASNAALVWASIHGLAVLVTDGWLPGRSGLTPKQVGRLPTLLAAALSAGLCLTRGADPTA